MMDVALRQRRAGVGQQWRQSMVSPFSAFDGVGGTSLTHLLIPAISCCYDEISRIQRSKESSLTHSLTHCIQLHPCKTINIVEAQFTHYAASSVAVFACDCSPCLVLSGLSLYPSSPTLHTDALLLHRFAVSIAFIMCSDMCHSNK